MFTGLVSDLGRVRAITGNGDRRIEFATGYDTATLDMGASVCCSGACLTVVEKGRGWFAVTVSGETLSKTTIGDWHEGTPVNFERSLTVGAEMGGHMVSGHVDDVARMAEVAAEGESLRMRFAAPEALERFIAAKGCVTLDGVSLTVNAVEGRFFDVNVIPHTRERTTLGALAPGDRVNLEIDMVARYVARLLNGD